MAARVNRQTANQMTCDDVRARDVAEEYLLGRLSPVDQEAYERHFFECDRCFAELEALRATASVLKTSVKSYRSPPPLYRWLAMAAVLVLAAATAVLLLRGRTEKQPPSSAAGTSEPPAATRPGAGRQPMEVLTRLARFEAPSYTPPRLRSATRSPDFEKGMERYALGDYAAAIPLLRAAVTRATDPDNARFYLAISLLQAGHTADGIAELETLGRDPQKGLAEDARFYSAYGHLQQGDAKKAIAALDRTIELEGDREAEARVLRAEIEKLRAPR